MEIKDIQRIKKKPNKITMTLRVSEDVSKWMKEKNISPTALFETSARELMGKEK